VDNATGAAQRGSALTKRLLSFSRSNDAHARPVDPNALIEGMSALFGSSLGSLVRVVRDLEPDMPFALVDPDQLELAVLNLCINARDAMPEGGTVTISTRRAEIHDDPDLKPGTYAVVTVADEGTGIPPEILERVCEPFFTTKAVGQGTGLGLAMVFGLAQQAGGRLRITSEVGRGTRIELALPRADGAAEGTESEVIALVPTATSPARILVVDDDPEVRHVTASFLNDFGYSETEAPDGRSALALMEQGHSFDLVVADLAMPGMTGVELATAIRQRFSGVPVLLLTGHAEAVQIPDDLPVMTKPFASAELAARVSQLLEATA
jgi:CheY-like chemotaxis protein/two-component sensor histidine kinase